MSAIHRRRFECVKLAILTIVLAAFMTGDALLLQELIASARPPIGLDSPSCRL